MTTASASAADMADVPPACPAGPFRTAVFCRDHWGVQLDLQDTATLRNLQRRERAIRHLRAAGDLKAADAAGWLSLAAIVVDAPARTITRLLSHSDPQLAATEVRTAASHSFGPFGTVAPSPDGQFVTSAGFAVPDAGSRDGWAVMQLAGRSAAGLVVTISSLPQAPGTVLSVLVLRLRDAAQRGAGR